MSDPTNADFTREGQEADCTKETSRGEAIVCEDK